MKLKNICYLICISLFFIIIYFYISGSKNVPDSAILPDKDTVVQSTKKIDSVNDYWPTLDWKVSSPEDQFVDSKILDNLVNNINQDEIYSFLMVKGGRIILEYYKSGWDRYSVFNFNSCAKSVISALIGITIEKKQINSVHDNISKYKNSFGLENIAVEYKSITIENLLMMTSGMEWMETQSVNEMLASSNWIGYILQRPIEMTPGASFHYNSGGVHLLSAIIQKQSGKNTLAFANDNIFKPIGISNIKWSVDPQGINFGGAWIEMTARDAAKFGYLYLKKGIWDNKAVLPINRVEESTKLQMYTNSEFGNYGYLWWTRSSFDNKYDMFFALGYGGQFILVIPKLDTVVVITAMLPDSERLKPLEYVDNYVLKSMKNN